MKRVMTKLCFSSSSWRRSCGGGCGGGQGPSAFLSQQACTVIFEYSTIVQ